MTHPFPSFIASLPEVDVPVEGALGRLFQGEAGQAVFFELQPGTVIPEHSHGAQWGVVLEGEIELTVSGQARRCRRGDSYAIPAGASHSARCPGGARVLDFFADRDRYRPR
ncbi:MAG: hypothetical protein Kow0092_21750 [Deferrisomatales bacterium]